MTQVRGKDRDYGFKTGKRGLKSGVLTIRQWKAANRFRHNGGTNRCNRAVGFWVASVGGRLYGTYRLGPKTVALPTPLGKAPR